jgi:RNA polymerase sigma-70 factor (ECF subfamily)
MPEDSPDLELILRFKSGDAAAFEDIVRAHQDRIYNLCRYLLRNEADAQDAAQDVFLKAFKGLKDFRPEASLYTWLYRIAVNTCIDRQRKPFFRSFFRESGSGTGADAGLLELRSDEPSPERLVESRQISQQIQSALKRLSPKLRAAIVLKEIEGLSYEEIGGVLEISLGTVKSRISRAREELQEILKTGREQNRIPPVQAPGE